MVLAPSRCRMKEEALLQLHAGAVIGGEANCFAHLKVNRRVSETQCR